MDLTSRLRSIVRGNQPVGRASSAPTHDVGAGLARPAARRELTYEPDPGYTASLDLEHVADMLAGRTIATMFGKVLVIDRRYESDRAYGGIRIDDCSQIDVDGLRLLDPELFVRPANGEERSATSDQRTAARTIFIDLETTGLSGGAGTIAFLVGCGYFDCGAFQVRQFLLPSHAAERALLAAVAEFFDGADLIVTYNGKTFDLPVMETRWLFHRMTPPLDGVPHFDMLHPARRLWRSRAAARRSRAVGRNFSSAMSMMSDYQEADERCCRLSTLERVLFDVERVGDVDGFEIPNRFFSFVRSGDPRPLEPVLEHNRLDLVSLAAVTARAAQLALAGSDACRDAAEALALGRVYERAGSLDRAETCYRCAIESDSVDVKIEALYRLGLRLRRDRRFEEAAEVWRQVLAAAQRRHGDVRRFAAEALAIHHEHRRRDLVRAREHALFALEESDAASAGDVRHRLARIERKLRTNKDAQLFSS